MDIASPGAKVLSPVAALIGSNETHLTEPAQQVRQPSGGLLQQVLAACNALR